MRRTILASQRWNSASPRQSPAQPRDAASAEPLHRARARLIAERTALINHLRALLLERGIVVANGRKRLEDALEVFADEEDARLSERMRLLVGDLRAEWRQLDARIAAFDAEFARMGREETRRPGGRGRSPALT